MSVSHWDTFQNIRKKHNENICIETNKLVLRLDKIINSDEDHVVEWTADDLIKLCPSCAKHFNIARRRHHCRTCGAVMCQSCSQFLEYKYACKLTKPARLYVDRYDRIEDRLLDKSVEENPPIRTCIDCKRLLDRRLQTITDLYSQPTFLETYEKLRSAMDEADSLLLHQRSNAELRGKVSDLRKDIVTMSSQIAKMAKSGKQAYLLDAIKQSVSFWLNEDIETKLKRADKPTSWAPTSQLAPEEDEDPLVTQIKILDHYIAQAKQAGRYEEISALEASKKELEIEYLIRKSTEETESMSLADPGQDQT